MMKPFTAYEGDKPYVFVCYAHDDASVVYPELERLHDEGIRIWYDEGIVPGMEWTEDLARHIEGCTTFLFFVTPLSVQSEHCRREVLYALNQSCQILVVELEPTELPAGLKLSLANRQAIVRGEYARDTYERKLISALRGKQEPPISTTALRQPRNHRILDRVAIPLLLLAAVSVIGLVVLYWSSAVVKDTELVITRFTDQSPDSRWGGVVDGLHDELTNTFTIIPTISVLAEGDVEFELNGNLRTTDTGLPLVTYQLTRSGRIIWSSSVTLSSPDDKVAYVEAATLITQTLFPALDASLDTLKQDTNDENARLAFLKAIMLIQSEDVSVLSDARAHVEQALQLDSGFAAAQALKAVLIHAQVNQFQISAREGRSKIRPLLESALAADPVPFLALTLNANLSILYGDAEAADRTVQEALQRNDADFTLADLLAICGRFDEALAAIDQQIERNPVSLNIRRTHAQILWYDRQMTEAAAGFERILARSPNDQRAKILLSWVYESEGRYDEAIQLTPFWEGVDPTLGQEGTGQRILDIADLVGQGRVPGFVPETEWRFRVFGLVRLGRFKEALDWMKKGWSLGDRFEFLAYRVYANPGFDEFRSQPGFTALMARTIGDPPNCPGYVPNSGP